MFLLAAVFAVYVVVKLVMYVVSIAVPVLVVVGVAAVLLAVVNRKALAGGSRRILP